MAARGRFWGISSPEPEADARHGPSAPDRATRPVFHFVAFSYLAPPAPATGTRPPRPVCAGPCHPSGFSFRCFLLFGPARACHGHTPAAAGLRRTVPPVRFFISLLSPLWPRLCLPRAHARHGPSAPDRATRPVFHFVALSSLAPAVPAKGTRPPRPVCAGPCHPSGFSFCCSIHFDPGCACHGHTPATARLRRTVPPGHATRRNLKKVRPGRTLPPSTLPGAPGSPRAAPDRLQRSHLSQLCNRTILASRLGPRFRRFPVRLPGPTLC